MAGFGTGAAGGHWVSEDRYPRELGDGNGDGHDDIVGFGGAGVYIALSNGDGTFAPGQLVLQALVATQQVAVGQATIAILGDWPISMVTVTTT